MPRAGDSFRINAAAGAEMSSRPKRELSTPLLRADHSVEVGIPAEPAAPARSRGGGGAAAAAFVRKTTKYWVRMRDVPLAQE